jgi:hypothetical protein
MVRDATLRQSCDPFADDRFMLWNTKGGDG